MLDQEEEADSLMKEVELMSSVTAPQALEELSNKSKGLKDSITVTQELIDRKKDQGEKSFLIQSIKGAYYYVCFKFGVFPVFLIVLFLQMSARCLRTGSRMLSLLSMNVLRTQRPEKKWRRPCRDFE